MLYCKPHVRKHCRRWVGTSYADESHTYRYIFKSFGWTLQNIFSTVGFLYQELRRSLNIWFVIGSFRPKQKVLSSISNQLNWLVTLFEFLSPKCHINIISGAFMRFSLQITTHQYYCEIFSENLRRLCLQLYQETSSGQLQ